MDKVLTRKLFRDKYFEKHNPKKPSGNGILSVPKFQEGGLSNRDKALVGLSLAGSLLQGRQRPGESMVTSTLRDVGVGFGQVPKVLIAASKLRKDREGIRQATAEEKRQLGYNSNDRLTVKVKNDRVVGIADKPTAGEREKAAKRAGTFQSANKINYLLEKLDYPTGPIQGRIGRTMAYLGFSPETAMLDTELENFRKEAIAVLRGAQVGPLEEASFDKILPSLTDRPDIVRAKMATAVGKLKAIEGRLNPDGTVKRQLTESDLAADPVYGKVSGPTNIKYAPGVPFYNLDGMRID